MNLRRLTTRAAGVGAAAALVSGALVGISTTAAQADTPGPVAYTCTVFGNALPVMVTPTGALLSELPPDSAISANAQTFTMNFTVPRAVLDGLAPYAVTKVGLSTNDFTFGLGDTPIPVTGLSASQTAVPASGDLVLPTTGKNGAYTTPGVGTYPLTMPSVFNAVVATDSPLVGSPSAVCAITDPTTATIGSVDVTDSTPVPPQSSTTTATAPKTVKKGAKVKIAVSVVTEAPATGTVTAKEGAKTLGTAPLADGKATITVKGLKPGKHTIKVTYSGDDSTTGSTSNAVKVTVKK